MIEDLVITDFGFSKERERVTKQHHSLEYSSIGFFRGPGRGTVAYAAPEIQDLFKDGGEAKYTKRSDIYSLGMVFGAIITGKEAFSFCNTEFQVLDASKPGFNDAEISQQLPLFQAIFKWCTSRILNDRPKSISDVLDLIAAFEDKLIQSTAQQIDVYIQALKNKY